MSLHLRNVVLSMHTFEQNGVLHVAKPAENTWSSYFQVVINLWDRAMRYIK